MEVRVIVCINAEDGVYHQLSFKALCIINECASKMKALKCKTLGAELAHAYAFTTMNIKFNICAFYPDDRLPNLNARR